MAFQLISPKSIDVEHADGGIIWGTLKEKPLFNERYSKIGSRAVWAGSLEALFNYMQTHLQEARKGKSSTRSDDSSFNTFTSYDEAMDTFRHNPHKIRRFVEKEENIKVDDQLGKDVYFDVSGDYLDIGRYLSGDPEHFGNMYLGNPRSVFATIMINVSAPWFVKEEVLRRRGERILRLVDWIEAQEIRTKILAFESNECTYTEVVVKRFEDSITLDNLAIVSHPEFLRRIIFRLAEYSDTWDSSYGTSVQAMRGYMSLPTSRESGIMILSENYDSIEEVDQKFDQAEMTIEKNLESGENQFSLTA